MAFCRNAMGTLFKSEGRLALEIEQELSSELLNMATLALAGTLCVRLFNYDSNSEPTGNDEVTQYARSTLAELRAAEDFVESAAGQDTTLVEFVVRLSLHFVPFLIVAAGISAH